MQTQHRRLDVEPVPQLEALITEQRSLIQGLSQNVQSLQKQLLALRSEVRQQSTLGFSNGRDYIIIERDKNILWHRFENDEPVPIKFKILKGYIKRVTYIDKEYPKLHVFIEGDREYVLVTGFETHFSRELLAAIATLTPDDLAHPVIIKPDISEGDSKHKPVFCNVIYQGRTVKPGTLRNLDILQLFQRAESVLQPHSVTPKRQVQKPSLKTVTPLNSSQAAVDWRKVCRDLNITTAELKAVAQSLGLPQGKLTRSQTGQLYQAVYQRYQATG